MNKYRNILVLSLHLLEGTHYFIPLYYICCWSHSILCSILEEKIDETGKHTTMCEFPASLIEKV